MASKEVIDTLIAEAGGEGEAGLIAAAWTVQQRAQARGLTLEETVRQDGAFAGFSNPGPDAIRAQADPAMRARVGRIMDGVISGTIPNPVPGADHFLSGSNTPSWAKKMTLVGTVGGHRFYASGNVPKAAQGVPAKSAVATPAGTVQQVTPAQQSAAMKAIRNPAPIPATRKPAPIPASPSAALAARRTGTPQKTAEGLNVRPVTTIKIDPKTGMPATQRVADAAPVANPGAPKVSGSYLASAAGAKKPAAPAAPSVSASDLARGKTRTVTASKPTLSASDLARGKKPDAKKPDAKTDFLAGAEVGTILAPRVAPVAPSPLGMTAALAAKRKQITAPAAPAAPPAARAPVKAAPAAPAKAAPSSSPASGRSAPAAAPKASAPPAPRQFQSGGYVYEVDGRGGYKKVGKVGAKTSTKTPAKASAGLGRVTVPSWRGSDSSSRDGVAQSIAS